MSALKGEKQQFTPFRLKNAVVQSAKSVEDPLGVGFIQVDKAWEYLENFKERKDLDLLYKVTVNKRGLQRGIYLRELDEVSQIQHITTKVEPRFMEEKDLANPKYNQAKFEYDVRVALVATESWITVPDYLYLHSSGNAFQVKVDPTALSESKFHYGAVLGYDTSAPERGPLFHVPVYVVKPTVPTHGSIQFKNVEYGPGDIIRRFVQVPEGATNCELVIKARATADAAPARFMLHLLQLVPRQNQKGKHAYSFMLGNGSFSDTRSDEEVIKKRFSVRSGLNLEVCLAQFWSGLGRHSIDLSLHFHGVQVAGNLANGTSTIRLEPEVTRLDISSQVRREDALNLSVSFNKLRKYLRPSSAEITPMHPERDLLPNGRLLYQLILSYKIKLDAATTITARFPTVTNQLYEHFLAGVFGVIYDANKQAVDYLDVFDHNIKMSQKGEYTIMLQLSTEEESVLDKLKDTILELDQDLKSVNFNTFKSVAEVYSKGASTVTKFGLERKDVKPVYVAAPTEALPKEAKAGDALVGKLNFFGNYDGGQYKVLYTVPPLVTESKDKKDEKKPTDEQVEKKLKEATRDLEISYLKKFTADSAAYKNLLAKVESTYANDIALLEFKLDALWTASAGKSSVDSLLKPGQLTQAQATEIIQVSDAILAKFNTSELFEFYGQKKPENESDEQKEQRKENDDKKKQLIHALKNKVLAYAAVLDKDQHRSEFDTSLKALQQWSSDDSSDLASLLIKVKQEREAGHPGNALKAIQKYLSDASFTADTIKDIAKVWAVRNELYKELGWDLWTEYDDKWNLIRQPPYGFALF